MQTADHIEYVEAEGTKLVEAASAAGFDAAVPACPDWAVRDLLTHIGGIHRWATDFVGEARQSFETAAGDAVGTGPGDDELTMWCTEGRRALVDTLRAASPDLACATFSNSLPPLAFWCRRQAHETAIHRADAETAAGLTPVFDTELALDGIDEIVTVFGGRKRGMTPSTLLLAPSDGAPIRVLIDDSGARVGAAGPTEATVSGTATQLYLWVWHRPAEISITGNEAAASSWGAVRPRWA